MKKSPISSVIAAIIIGSTTVVAHASGYDPVAPNRYSATLPTYDQAASIEHTARPAGLEAQDQGFHPFAANRYTSLLSSAAGEQKEGRNVAISHEGGSFNPFAPDRYTK